MWNQDNRADYSYRQPACTEQDSSSSLNDCFLKMSIFEAKDDERINAEHNMTITVK